MIQRISILLMIMLPSLLMGQVFSSKGRFSVQFDRGCNSMTVNVSEHDSFGDITRQYFYEENSNITNSKTHTYASAKTYDIIQVIGVDNQGSKFDTLKIEVFDSKKPVIRIEKCSGNEISVESGDNRHDFIRVYFGGADSVQLDLKETTTHIFASNSVQTIGLKGFFLNADENCSEYFEEVIPIPSLPTPTVSEVGIKETCKGIYSMYLELDSFDSLITYQVELIQVNSSVLFEGKLDSDKLILSDIPFNISQSNFCIQVNSLDPCNSSKIEGSQVCKEISNLSLSPFESLFSSYESNGILINLDRIESGIFIVYRKIEGQEFELEDSVTSTYIDAIGSKTRKYFYKLDYVDSCNQILYSAETNPPFISAAKTSKNSYSVDFIFPNPLSDGTYFVESIVGDGINSSNEHYRVIKNGDITPFNFELDLNAKDGTRIQYLTTKIYSLQGKLLQSNTINLKFDVLIYVPTAFTPNNDGLNDTLEVFGLPSNEATINIYSKWGHLIYSSNNSLNGWDGTINGQLAPEGTYLYEIIFESTEDEKLQQKGTFALIKK